MAKGKDGKTSGPGGEPGGKSGAGEAGSDGTAPGRSNERASGQGTSTSQHSGRAGDGSGTPTQSSDAGAIAGGQTAGEPNNDAGGLVGPGASRSSVNGPPAGNGERLGKTGRAPDYDNPELINRTEKEAAAKLRQAVQRIKADRERRGEPVRAGPGSSTPETKRDW